MGKHQSIKNIYLNSIENPAYIVDTSGILLDWNSRFCESFGLNDSDLIDKRLDQILPESIHQNNMSVITRKLKESETIEVFKTQKNLPRLFCSQRKIITENGKISGLVNILQPYLLEGSCSVVSWKIHHQLRHGSKSAPKKVINLMGF